jgi:type I restriction enzyme S subunit
MSNFVPKGWESSDIRALVKFIGGSQPPRDTFIFQKKEGYVRLLQIRDYKSDKYASFIPTSLSRRWCNKDDIMIGRYGPPIFQIMRGKEGSYNVALIKAEPKSDKLLKSYLYEFIRRDDLFHVIDSYSQRTSGQTGIDMDALNDFHFPLPPLPEQQKIAQILTSVDEVIEKTQAQIDKLKDLKTAMMQELLTKGIGHIEFKDSPVGRIPVGWEVKTLEALSSFVTSGSRGWAQYYSSTGAIFIRIGNLTREHINFRFKDIIYVTPPNSAEGKRTLVQEGDVLISITADLGIIAVVNESIGEAYVNQHVSLVRLDDPSMARWVGHFLAFEDSRKQFTANNDAGAKAGLNLTAIRKTQVALPSKNERRKIVEALDSVDKLISEKRRKLNVTNDTKKALMQDLLTGKVRVS